ncbi:unnamed protein product [Peniophora sp. CBMAI 1063]|nr:unnamed protein product [Peniophora sp. CBMAI 1063]
MPMLIDVAELSGLAVEGALYGVFLCLFLVCAFDLLKRRARGKATLNWPVAVAGVLLIVLATARFSVDTANVFVAFISHDPREARIAYLADPTQPLFTTKHSILICVLLVGDSFVNYRCWIVWGKRLYVVLFPIALSFTSAAAGSYTMWAYSHLPNQTILSEAKWLKAFFSLSLVANAVATSLLAYRIWAVNRQTQRALATPARGDSSRLTPIIRIVLESGIFNAMYLFVYVMTLEFGSQGLEIMSEMSVQLTGIIFSTIIFRISRQSHDDSYYSTAQLTTLQWRATKNSGPSAGTGSGTSTAITTARFKSRDQSSTLPDEIEVPLEQYHDGSYATYDDIDSSHTDSRAYKADAV